MKNFFKENYLHILLVTLLALLFVFWGRTVVREIKLNTNTQMLHTLEARLNCLKSYGWTVDEGSETRRDTAIPDPLDDVWEAYNALQTVCGFDLRKYQGKKVTCYTYIAQNFPYDVGAPVYINLLICDGNLIGGDCMTTALDGFMLPLDRRYLP